MAQVYSVFCLYYARVIVVVASIVVVVCLVVVGAAVTMGCRCRSCFCC